MTQQEMHGLVMWMLQQGDMPPRHIWDCITEQIACEMIVDNKSPTWQLLKRRRFKKEKPHDQARTEAA